MSDVRVDTSVPDFELPATDDAQLRLTDLAGRTVWRGVKVKGHADEVLAAVRELG